ncbi:gliding motility-associated C-terminal domain-containing protein [uncultured Psychroserpens sp.]|uniref:fibronectin type III domain-containing protein n=1 Tax=uncultured Psychroserpens sp. TaxID=255436 RepID=UPI00263A0B52|nr:gliding motility-associated C-terminal domain-containing protein [uncultured Psychroserpens sp.]
MKKITLSLALLFVFSIWHANAQITSYPYFEDFESGDGGWIVDNPANGSWELGVPANTIINSADSGTNAWVTNLTGNYNTNESAAVVSPVFDFTGISAPSIEFSIWWNAEFSWDGMVLQSSIDGGGSWQNVGDLGDPNNWFNDGSIGGDPGGQEIGWTGREAVTNNGSNGWVVARHALEGLGGESNVILRFAFGSDGSVQDEGIGFDSVNIFDVSCPEPFDVIVDNITDTTADINWTASGSETNWEIVVQTAGTGVPTGSGTATMNNPYTAMGLSAVTDYEVYLRADCGSEFSSWVGPINFQSACGVFVPDYLEQFDTIIPNCWDEADDGDATTGPLNLGGGLWGNDGFLNNGFTGAYKINLYQGGVRNDWILSPQFDLTGGPFQVDFDFGIMQFASSTNAGTLGSDDTVQLLMTTDNGGSWITLITFDNTSVVPATGTQVVFDLTPYSGQTVRFGILGSEGTVDDPEDNDVFVDNFRVRNIPTCQEPSGITIDGFTDTTANISWTPGGAETSWEVAVQPVGTGVPAGAGDPTTNNPYSASGLTAITDYEVWVRADCGTNGLSSWIGPVNFTTACSVFVPEYLETFGTIIPDCWDEADDGDATTGPLNLGGGLWGNDGFLNDGFTGAYKINLYQGGVRSDWILSPYFDLTGGPFQVDFDFGIMQFASSTTAGTLGSDDTVQLLMTTDNGGSWITLITFDNTSVVPATGTQVVFDLTPYSGQTVRFGILGSEGTVDDPEDNDVFVDNFRVRNIPTCPEPNGLSIDGFSDTTADISWTPGGAETSWEVVIQPAGTGLPTGAGDPTTNNPYSASGLTASTDYEVWVRADCGASGLSSWVGPVPFTTFSTPPPPPVGVTCTSGSSSFIFTAEFDAFDGWTGDLTNTNEDGSWEIPGDSGSGGTGPDVAFSGANYMNYEASGGTTDTASAVTPAIDLTPAVDGAELSFYMHAYGEDMGIMNVGVGNDPTGPFTTVFTWDGEFQTGGDQPWIPIGVNLDTYLGQVIYIEFSHTGTGDFEGDMSIDLVRVETCGSFCIAPSSIFTSNVTQTTADIDWTANSGETAWEYVVVPAGTGEPTGSGNPVTSTSITETGLDGGTEYEIWVRADCGGGTFSLWSGPIPFFTAPVNNDPCSAITAVVNTDDTCDLTTFGTILQATPSGVPSGSCTGNPDDDVWFQFVATNEVHLLSLINIAGGTFNIDHALYEGTDCNNLVELDCSDGDASVTPQLVIGNTYYIRVFSGGSDDETSTFDLCIRDAPTNIICENAENFCPDAGGGLSNPNIIGIPDNNDLACLGTAPNPTWNIIQIGDPGLIEIEINQEDDAGNGLDVDFVLWGPFDSVAQACTEIVFEDCPSCPNNTTNPDFYPFGNIVDCSYSAAAVENLTIDNALEGEIYLLLVTNFSDDPGTISISQTNDTGGAGNGNVTADITVDLGPDQELCGFPSYEIIADSPFADRAEWYCDGFIIDGETDLSLVVTESCTYTVIVYDDQCNAQAQDSVTITFGIEPTANPVADMVTCDDASGDEIEDFDLESQTATILGGQDPAEFNVTYHLSLSDAQLGTGALTSPHTNGSNPETIYVRVENVGATFCTATTSTFDLIISGPTPTATTVTYEECDDDFDGFTDFDLASQDANVLNGQSATDFTVTYYETQADADAGTGAIDTSLLYNSDTRTVFVRVESNVAFDCFSTTTMALVVKPLPDTSFTTDFDYEVCPNATVPVLITATANNYSESEVNIVWYQDGGIIAGENSLTLPVLEAGFYEIEVTFNDGTMCSSIAGQTIIELESCVIPQGISPNGDGMNDTFDLSSYDVSKLEIFNRNGTLVYSKNDYTNEWHGQTSDGEELPVGTYFYTMEYENGKRRSAWIYIQRLN